MTRAIIATATAFVAATALMSTAAEACLSCEYVPEVVRPHATSPLAYGRGDSGSSHATYSARARFSSRDDDAPRAKKVAKIDRSEKREKVAKASKSESSEKVAKASRPDKSEPIRVAKEEKVEKPAKVAKVSKPENSEPVKVANAEPVEKRPERKPAVSENSSITIAAVTETEAPAVAEAASRPTDCKKFFASVGMTLTVPCE